MRVPAPMEPSDVSPLGRAAVAIPAFAAMAGCAWMAAKHGVAEAQAYEASREVASWNGTEPPRAGWDSAHERLAEAQALAPESPTVHELLGQLDAARGDSDERLRTALHEFRTAAALRPTSPYTWASVARLEYQSGRTGRDFEVALGTAAALGPSEPEVQRTVIDLGLATYAEIGADTRRAVDRSIDRAVRRNEKEVLTIAERRGRLAAVCARLTASSRAASRESGICQEAEEQP